MAFLLGLILLKDTPSLRLALLVVGCSPGGGASNIWTVLLNGNVNLSVTMTFVSSIVAFGESTRYFLYGTRQQPQAINVL